eukprot:scaffold321746_cov32-Tisochrysis_lutea.AAC.1
MRFVDHDHRVAREQRVEHHLGEQSTISDKFDPRVFPRAAVVEAHGIPDSPTEMLAHLLGNALRDGHGRHAPRLRTHDGAAAGGPARFILDHEEQLPPVLGNRQRQALLSEREALVRIEVYEAGRLVRPITVEQARCSHWRTSAARPPEEMALRRRHAASALAPFRLSLSSKSTKHKAKTCLVRLIAETHSVR